MPKRITFATSSYLVLAAAYLAKANSVLAAQSVGTAKDLGVPDLTFEQAVGTAGGTTGVIGILSIISGVVAVIYIVMGGIRYASSSGNPAQIESAKKTLTYAVTGLVVSLLAASIVAFVIASSP